MSDDPTLGSPIVGDSSQVDSPRNEPIVRLRSWLTVLTDWFLPSEPREGLQFRTRLIVITGLWGATAILGAILVAPELESLAVRIASYALVGIFLLVPLMIKAGVDVAFARGTLLTVLVLYASGLAAAAGGRDTGAIFVAMLMPLLATLMGGIRVGIFWSLLMCGAMLSVGTAVSLGFEAPIRPDLDEVGLWSLWASAAGVLGGLGVAATYEWLRADLDQRLVVEKQRGDRLHAEQRLSDKRLQADLQDLVDERSRALEDSLHELRHVERLASLGTLAAGVAHQINNPIGAILVSSQYALSAESRSDRDEVWKTALETSEAEALRCAQIVKALLRFSRQGSSQKMPHDLNAMTHAAISSLSGALHSNDFRRIETTTCHEELRILANSIEIEQVLVNLIRNGLQASAASGGSLRVVTSRHGDFGRIVVQDSGVGISREDQDRIFEPFFTSRGNDGGTGLGLSIVHGIIQDHQGSIDVGSELGEGSTFTALLPLLDRSADQS